MQARRLLLAACVLVGLFALSALLPIRRVAALHPHRLPANGTASARLVWQLESIYGTPVPFYPWDVELTVTRGAERIRIVGPEARREGPASLVLGLRATGEPGPVELELDTGTGRLRFGLELVSAGGDRDTDGMPDEVELADPADRQAFRQWFTAIAESQFYAPDPRWEQVHRDCAGLLRFAYTQALRAHDRRWLAERPYLHRSPSADVRRYSYPDVPVIGTRVFRTAPGVFRAGDDPARDFAVSASALVLAELNCLRISGSAADALPGDLLFFRDIDNPHSPMHSMVLLAGERVVYHTGPVADGPGEVRLVRLADLDRHRDERWHARADNPHFLGFYRWKILEGGRP